MNISQFTRDDRYDFHLYKWDGVIETEIGYFGIEIQIMDNSPLTDELVGIAFRLSETGKLHTQKILDIIFQNYKGCNPISLMDFDGSQPIPGRNYGICGLYEFLSDQRQRKRKRD